MHRMLGKGVPSTSGNGSLTLASAPSNAATPSCPVKLEGKLNSQRVIYHYHKTGTHMFSTSKQTMEPVLDGALTDARVLPLPSEPPGSATAAQNSLCRSRMKAVWSWTGNPYGCFAAKHCRQALPKRRTVQLVRDPFAQIASSYLYHRGSTEEPWTSWPLDEDLQKRRSSRGWLILFWSVKAVFEPSASLAWLGRPPLHQEVLSQVILRERRAAKRFSASSPPLPHTPGETYADYLVRVPVKEGLFAEAQRMARFDFVLMQYDAHNAGNAIQVCVEALGDVRRTVCLAAWARMLKHQQYPEVLESRLLNALVNATCPSAGGQLAAGHVKVSRASKRADGLDARALRRLVMELDVERFRGELSNHARLHNCSNTSAEIVTAQV